MALNETMETRTIKLCERSCVVKVRIQRVGLVRVLAENRQVELARPKVGATGAAAGDLALARASAKVRTSRAGTALDDGLGVHHGHSSVAGLVAMAKGAGRRGRERQGAHGEGEEIQRRHCATWDQTGLLSRFRVGTIDVLQRNREGRH